MITCRVLSRIWHYGVSGTKQVCLTSSCQGRVMYIGKYSKMNDTSWCITDEQGGMLKYLYHARSHHVPMVHWRVPSVGAVPMPGAQLRSCAAVMVAMLAGCNRP